MLISEKTTESIENVFASKEAYPIVRKLEKMMVEKAQAKVVKCSTTQFKRVPELKMHAVSSVQEYQARN